jgi:hypothetical protein
MKLDPDQTENQTDGAKRKRDWVTKEKDDHERREHDRRHVFGQQGCHGVAPL